MKWIIVIFCSLLAGLQYRLWIGEGSLAHRAELQREIDQQQQKNQLLEEQNSILALEVEELKSGHQRVEERARQHMGMIKEGETFFMVMEPSTAVHPVNKDKHQQNP